MSAPALVGRSGQLLVVAAQDCSLPAIRV